jgi:hypothetical protein
MSNFTCEYCGTEIVEDFLGYYITGCPHYPISDNPRNKKNDISKLMAEAMEREKNDQ